MLQDKDKIFTNLYGDFPCNLKSAKERGDFIDLDNILAKDNEELISIVKDSNLRGRGGAGFPTGVKWSFIPKDDDQHYLVINADESEPGTCKDRDIILFETYKLIEGAIITAKAIKASICYIYIRGEYYNEYLKLKSVIQELYNNNLLGANIAGTDFSLDIHLRRGAGAYICGEETALLESIEGKKGQPRLKPPFPAIKGLFGKPTVINNVESIAVIGSIIKKGAKWFKSFGKENNTGTKIFSISGHVNNPCNVEEELGISLKTLIEEYAGGVVGGWDNLLAVIPGGSSVPLIPKNICDYINMDFDSLKEVGSGLGTAAVIVMNKDTDIIAAIARLSKFYYHESCGQCTPCREGT